MREPRRGGTPSVAAVPVELAPYLLPPGGDPVAWALASSVASEGLWYFDVASDEVRLAPRTLELLGYRAGERPADRTEVSDHIHPRDLVLLQRAIGRLLRGPDTRTELELRLVTTTGASCWTLFRARALRGDDGLVRFVAGSLADIDHRKRDALRLREASRRDALTGLPNRIALDEQLVARIAAAVDRPSDFAVLYADLDRFKYVNDTLGHAAGDALLLETVRRIESALGAGDLLARIGGDEFVALLDDVPSPESALAVAELVQQAMRAPIPSAEEAIYAALSIGVRLGGDGGTHPGELLRDADIAMYEAKRQGGARSVLFADGMYATMAERLRRQSAMHRIG
jgi:diguanylate cyclase (GGDEF)-like protein